MRYVLTLLRDVKHKGNLHKFDTVLRQMPFTSELEMLQLLNFITQFFF